MTLPALSIPDSITHIARVLEDAGYEAWCVGGSLRDSLLGYPHSDFDIATSAKPEEVQRLFPRTVAVGLKYGTVGVLDRMRVLHEVTTFRRDVLTDGRHAVVEYGVSLEEDLARRDFTVNAMAYHPLRREWRDPFGGQRDIAASLIRAVGDARERFREDYLRILRALRFSARFDFSIEPSTWEAALAETSGLAQLSAERVREEWFKGLQTAHSIGGLASLWLSSGAARSWIPELEEGPAAQEAFPEPRSAERDPILLTALLTGKPSSVLRRLKASNAEIERARRIETGPDQPAAVDDHSIRRWLSDTGSAADDLLSLWRMRHQANPPWQKTVEDIRRRGDPLTRSDLAVTGNDLQALGAQGPEVGRALSLLLERVLEDPSLNTREHLLKLARELR